MQLADPPEYFGLPLISFWSYVLLILNQIFMSTHAPQFWDKIILFQNYFLWPLHVPLFQPPAMIFGPFVDPFHRPFLIKDISKIMMFGHSMVIILLTSWATLLFQLMLIADPSSFLESKFFYHYWPLHQWSAFWIDHFSSLVHQLTDWTLADQFQGLLSNVCENTKL